jgi:hypothetical protein
MKHYGTGPNLFVFVMAVLMSISVVRAAEKESTTANAGSTTASAVPVRMTVTLSVLGDRRMPDVGLQDVMVKQGKERMRVTSWQRAGGEGAGLDLFILIDDASDSSLGSQLNSIRDFINTQPPTTSVGIGYMRNATVDIVQNFTTDRAQAAKALRLPTGSVGAFGSPYLSAVNLMNRWPKHANRRVLMLVTDGIDRARRTSRTRMPSTNPDVNSAATVAQRTGTIIYGFYTPGVGHPHRNFWEASNGQNDMARLSELSGGESYFLGLQAPVSFKPYFEALQKNLDNQFLLEFDARSGKRAGLQPISLSTEVAGVELISADSVWVPSGK